jgi:hypothetical protein
MLLVWPAALTGMLTLRHLVTWAVAAPAVDVP